MWEQNVLKLLRFEAGDFFFFGLVYAVEASQAMQQTTFAVETKPTRRRG